MIEGLAQKKSRRLTFPRKVLQQKTLTNTKWIGTESVIRQSNVSSSRKIPTVSWTSRINLNTSKRAKATRGDRITDRTTQQGDNVGVTGGLVAVGDTEVRAVTRVVIEDRIIRFMGAERSIRNIGDHGVESKVFGDPVSVGDTNRERYRGSRNNVHGRGRNNKKYRGLRGRKVAFSGRFLGNRCIANGLRQFGLSVLELLSPLRDSLRCVTSKTM